MRREGRFLPMGWVTALMSDIDRFVEDILSNTSFRLWRGLSSEFQTVPAVNIQEEPDKYTIEVACPGMKKEDFSLEIQDDLLIIRGEKKEERKEEESKYTRREFRFSRFERRFSLPEDVLEDGIKATYRDGILYITIPRKQEEKQREGRRIEIE